MKSITRKVTAMKRKRKTVNITMRKVTTMEKYSEENDNHEIHRQKKKITTKKGD